MTLTCSCGKRRRTLDESMAIHGPECCTCPRGTRVHIKGCIASYGSRVEGLPAEPDTGYASSRGAKLLAGAACALALAAGFTAEHWSPWAQTSVGDMVKFEDGSGIQYDEEGRVVKEYPADTFEWDCETMGNRICGDIDDADVTP